MYISTYLPPVLHAHVGSSLPVWYIQFITYFFLLYKCERAWYLCKRWPPLEGRDGVEGAKVLSLGLQRERVHAGEGREGRGRRRRCRCRRVEVVVAS